MSIDPNHPPAAAGQADATAHADAPGHAASTDAHGSADHGHDDHGHGGETLGPIDVRAWGAGLLGVMLGLAVAACFVLATVGAPV